MGRSEIFIRGDIMDNREVTIQEIVKIIEEGGAEAELFLHTVNKSFRELFEDDQVLLTGFAAFTF
jgi:uncharacterized protein with ATP-grasp and redox domains